MRAQPRCSSPLKDILHRLTCSQVARGGAGADFPPGATDDDLPMHSELGKE